MKNLIFSFLEDYFYLRQRIPIFVYVFYLHFKDSDNPAIKGSVKIIVSLIGLSTVYAITGLIFKIPFKVLIPLGWGYAGLVTWGVFILIYYFIVNKKTKNNLTAFTFAMLAATGGGWLYEIWFFHPLKMWMNNTTIFLINGQILYLILLGYELKKRGFKINRSIGLALGVFLTFSLFLFLDFEGTAYQFKMKWGPYAFVWFCRVPACNFLLSLLGGIKNKADP